MMLMSHSLIGIVLMIFFFLPLKAMSAVRMMVKEIRFRMNVIASTCEDLVFHSIFRPKLELTTCSTVSAKNERDETSVFNFTNTGYINKLIEGMFYENLAPNKLFTIISLIFIAE